MKILVLNSGSSSLKYQVIDMETEKMLVKGYFERIGQPNSFLTHKVNGVKHKFEHQAKNHEQAIKFVLSRITNDHYGVIKDLSELAGIGHRVVHGGEKFSDSVLITDEVIKEIEECSNLAPLHNPAAVLGMEACRKVVPNIKMVAVFDTAFHQTIPKERYVYPIPYEYYEKYGIRKYGFHGTSHKYVAGRVAELMGKDIKDLKIVNCHLGQGASVCAIQDGKSVETSMGLTPLGGIVMGSRSGDLDPSVVTYIMNKEKLTPEKMENRLNKESGVYGISNVSLDFRDIEIEAQSGGIHAKLALDVFHDSVVSYIAKCMVAMNGMDVLTFTAGVGEKGQDSRQEICDRLKVFGVELDNEINQASKGKEAKISSENSKVEVYAIPTNEELMIARETMKILVLNCGSSSLKYQLINMETEEVLASGKYERIGEEEAFITHKAQGKKVEIKKTAYDHKEAIEFTLAQLTNPEYKVIDSLDEIEAIGHRVVHGGEIFKESAVIDDKVIKEIEECGEFAPLHNPAAVLGMEACKKVMPGKPMVAVFDTTFHQTMPKEKYVYPIPYEYYKKYGVRKYGAHGTSHMYVSQRLAEIENKDIKDLKIVTCHLGQGSSICAVEGGKSIDTSMGLTPLGGIPMVTRSGDLDPSVLTYIMKKENISAGEMEDILNKKSGVAGISGLAPDFRVIETASNEGDEKAEIAMESFKYAVASYIAKYAVAMNGVDYIIFTGGVGENQINIRKGICEKLGFMGVEIDVDENNMRGEEKVISKPESKVKVYVIPTNEELMIAKETMRLSD